MTLFNYLEIIAMSVFGFCGLILIIAWICMIKGE